MYECSLWLHSTPPSSGTPWGDRSERTCALVRTGSILRIYTPCSAIPRYRLTADLGKYHLKTNTSKPDIRIRHAGSCQSGRVTGTNVSVCHRVTGTNVCYRVTGTTEGVLPGDRYKCVLPYHRYKCVLRGHRYKCVLPGYHNWSKFDENSERILTFDQSNGGKR